MDGLRDLSEDPAEQGPLLLVQLTCERPERVHPLVGRSKHRRQVSLWRPSGKSNQTEVSDGG